MANCFIKAENEKIYIGTMTKTGKINNMTEATEQA